MGELAHKSRNGAKESPLWLDDIKARRRLAHPRQFGAWNSCRNGPCPLQAPVAPHTLQGLSLP